MLNNGDFKVIPKEELEEMYWVDKMTQSEIGELVGVSGKTISHWMRMCGVASRIISEKPPKEKLRQMYWDKGMSQQEIADDIGVGLSFISLLMKKYGIKTQTLSRYGNRFVKPSKEELEQMYFGDMMSQQEIGDYLGIIQQTILDWFKLYGIKSRTYSEARIGKFTGENHPNWKGGISGRKYCYKFNNKFREAVRERDDYTCQLCGYEQKLDGRRLSIHHIHYDKENCYPDVVTLCCSCNSRVNGDRDYWEEYFENQLIERGLFCWNLR